MASKIFDTQNWRIYCDTEEDQATATNLKIKAKSPSGTVSTFTGVLDDTNNNRIYYDVATSEITEAGEWAIWPNTTISSKVAPGDPAVITIYAEGDHR